jgi:hypothetical protein
MHGNRERGMGSAGGEDSLGRAGGMGILWGEGWKKALKLKEQNEEEERAEEKKVAGTFPEL